MDTEKLRLIVNIGDHTHMYECDQNTPHGEIYDAICKFKSYILNEMVKKHNAEVEPLSEVLDG